MILVIVTWLKPFELFVDDVFFSVMTRAAFSKQDGMYDVPDRFIDYKFQRLSIESWWFLPNVIRDNVFTVYSGC